MVSSNWPSCGKMFALLALIGCGGRTPLDPSMVSSGAVDLGVPIGSVTIKTGSPFAMSIVENLLYVADWGNNTGVLSIIDVTDPSRPRMISTYASSSAEIHGLAVDGGRAYLANDTLGLTVVDVSDSSHPSLMSSRDGVGGPAYGHCVALGALGTKPAPYAMMGGFYGASLNIFPITDANRLGDPIVYKSPASNVRDILDVTHANGIGYLFVGDGEKWMGVETVDLGSLPAVPQRLGSLSMPVTQYGGWGRERLLGKTLYIATSAHDLHVGGLHIVDVSDPRAPRMLGDLDLPDLGNVWWEGVGLDVAGSRAYVVGKTALHVVDVADPRKPVEKATLHLPSAYANGIGGNVVVQGDYVYAAASALQSTRGAVVVFKVKPEP